MWPTAKTVQKLSNKFVVWGLDRSIEGGGISSSEFVIVRAMFKNMNFHFPPNMCNSLKVKYFTVWLMKPAFGQMLRLIEKHLTSTLINLKQILFIQQHLIIQV